MDQSIEWLTAKGVMKKIGYGRTQLYHMIKTGIFPAPIKIGKSSRWPKSKVESWMMSFDTTNQNNAA